MEQVINYLIEYWQPLSGIILGFMIFSGVVYFHGWNKKPINVLNGYLLMFSLLLIVFGFMFLFSNFF